MPNRENGQVPGEALVEKALVDYQDPFFINFNRSFIRNFWFLGTGALSLLTPLVNIFLLFGWFVIFFGLFAIGIVFKFATLLHLDKLLSEFSRTFADGQSLVQWGDLSLYDLKEEKKLQDQLNSFSILKERSASPNYDIPVAKSLILLSGLVYEHFTLIQEVATRWKFELGETIFGPGESRVQIFYAPDSDKVESKTVRGGGKKRGGTIVVTFRGTNPLNLSEWLTDINLLKTDARPFFPAGGKVHAGFLERLFGRHVQHKHNTVESLYVAIIAEINKVTQILSSGSSTEDSVPSSPNNVKLWVTGHSLGAAIATLFYARLLQSESDLRGAKLVGAYTYGCPRTADYDFVMNAITSERSILDEYSPNKRNIWRVVNANDIVPRVPIGLGLCSDTLRQGLSNGFLDYYHFGKKVQLHYGGDAHLHHESESIFSGIWSIISLFTDYLWHWSWLYNVLTAVGKRDWPKASSFFLPWFVADHAPALYYHNIGQIDPSPKQRKTLE